MRKIFLLTDGEYSDYHIIGAFSTEKKAQKYIDMQKRIDKYHYPSIEEFTLDEYNPIVISEVIMRYDGEVIAVRQSVGSIADTGFDAYTFDNELTKKSIIWNVHTKIKERAIKVVNEKRAQLIAMNIWGNDLETKKYLGISVDC
jgi:hypothetical protein